MFTSGVVLKGLSLSRSWSLLTLFGLAQLVTNGGCVRELTVMPDNQSAESTGTQEQGPGAGAGEVGTSTQAPTTSQATGTTSSAPVVTDSGTGEVTSGTSSATETQEEDTGDPNAACVSDGQDRQCVPKAPVGWYGPVGLLQASDAKDTQVCKAHSEIIDELIEEPSAPAIECTGCSPKLKYPDSLRAQAVEYKSSSCGEDSEVARSPIGDWFCHRLEPKGDANAAHWKMLVPKAEGELTCVGGDESSNKKPVSVNNYFRGCQVERKGKCESAEDVCAKKGVGPTCVYREGDVDCPSAYSQKRQLLFSGVEDTRACSECKADMKKQGSWSLQGKLSFYKQANCIPETKKRSFDLSELSERCDAESVRKEKEWNFARLELTQPKFDGVCETSGWEPQGEVKGKNPVTVCCRGIDGQF